jgi:hypothetical protein
MVWNATVQSEDSDRNEATVGEFTFPGPTLFSLRSDSVFALSVVGYSTPLPASALLALSLSMTSLAMAIVLSPLSVH